MKTDIKEMEDTLHITSDGKTRATDANNLPIWGDFGENDMISYGSYIKDIEKRKARFEKKRDDYIFNKINSNNSIWDKQDIRSEFEKYFKKLREEEEAEKEEIIEDENLDLIMFYGKLLVEKLARMPILGKMEIDGDFSVKRMGMTDVYKIGIEIVHNIENQSIQYVNDIIDELKQLEDGKNNVSMTIDGTIYVKIKVDYIDIKDLEPAKDTVTKFKL